MVFFLFSENMQDDSVTCMYFYYTKSETSKLKRMQCNLKRHKIKSNNNDIYLLLSKREFQSFRYNTLAAKKKKKVYISSPPGSHTHKCQFLSYDVLVVNERHKLECELDRLNYSAIRQLKTRFVYFCISLKQITYLCLNECAPSAFCVYSNIMYFHKNKLSKSINEIALVRDLQLNPHRTA